MSAIFEQQFVRVFYWMVLHHHETENETEEEGDSNEKNDLKGETRPENEKRDYGEKLIYLNVRIRLRAAGLV